MSHASELQFSPVARRALSPSFECGGYNPGLLEDLERQHTENHATRGDHDVNTNPTVTIITCPNELVALSAAQGYAQVTGHPAAVIVHDNLGNQVSLFSHVDELSIDCYVYCRRWPESFTMSIEGEHEGTRNEWTMWLQGMYSYDKD